MRFRIAMLILNLPLIPYMAYRPASGAAGTDLAPLIMFFSLCGIYLVSFNTFDIQLMVLFAVLAIVLRLTGYPMAPLILGFVLGRLMEENLRRALEIGDGWNFVWERPIPLVIFILTALCLIALLREMMAARRGVKDELVGEGG